MIDGIESARLKLIRAAEHIKAVEACIKAYAASDSYKVVPQANGKEQVYILREPPDDISLLSGEAFYQIRSALDHLVFELVKFNPGNIALPVGWEKRCEFPLMVDVPTKGNPPVPYNLPVEYGFFAKNLPGITVPAYTFIERVQPYNASSLVTLGPLNIFSALAKLSNIDKHRHFNVVVSRSRMDELLTSDTGAQRGGWSILNDKAELEQVIGTDSPMGRTVDVQRSFETIVTFGESTLNDDMANVPVQYVLKLCAYAVQTFIVPAFEKFVQHL